MTMSPRRDALSLTLGVVGGLVVSVSGRYRKRRCTGMTLLDWWNLVASVMVMLNVAHADEAYVYLYNRAVIALRDV